LGGKTSPRGEILPCAGKGGRCGDVRKEGKARRGEVGEKKGGKREREKKKKKTIQSSRECS